MKQIELKISKLESNLNKPYKLLAFDKKLKNSSSFPNFIHNILKQKNIAKNNILKFFSSEPK